MVPTANEDYDVVIEQPDGTRHGFNVVRTPNVPVFGFDYLPSLSPRQESGNTSYSQVPPNQEISLVLRDAVDGSGNTQTSVNDIRSSAWADNVDSRAAHELTLGSSLSAVAQEFAILPDGDFEDNDIDDNWQQRGVTGGLPNTSGGSATIAAVTTSPRNGTYCARLYLDADNYTPGYRDYCVYELHNKWGIGHFKGSKITFGAWFRTAESSSSNNVYMVIIDDTMGAADPIGSTYASTNITMESIQDWTYKTVSHTVSSSATKLWVGFWESGSHAENMTIFMDDARIFGGQVTTDNKVVKMINRGSDSYMVTSGEVWKTDGDLIYCGAGEILDAEVFMNTMYVAHSGTTPYSYSTDTETWVVSVIPSTGKNAHKFRRSRNVLWKIYNDDVASSINPILGGTWSADGDIGDTSGDVTSLFSYSDRPYIGRTDGIFQYNRADDVWVDMTPEYAGLYNTDNFKYGTAHQGWFYLSTANGFFRFDGTNFQSLRNLIFPSGLEAFGNRIKSMTTDGEFLYVLQEDELAETSASKSAWLIALREDLTKGSGVLTVIPYVLGKLAVGNIGGAIVNTNDLFIGGHQEDSKVGAAGAQTPRLFSYTLPSRHFVPAHDTTPALTTSGEIIFPAWDAGFPDVTKVFTKFTIKLLNANANRTVAVKYLLDGDINTATSSYITLGTANSNGDTTFDFSGQSLANRTGKTISISYALATNDATESPLVLAGVLKAVLNTTRLKRLSITLRTQGALGADDDFQAGLPALLKDTYIDTAWPLKLDEDFDNSGTVTSHNVRLENVRERVLIDEDGAETVYECEFWEVNI
jgi:hypothetical protein